MTTNWRRRLSPALASVLLSVTFTGPAAASSKDTAASAARTLADLFLGISGTWFTDRSGIRGLGSPKFGGGSTTLYGKEAHRGKARIAGGFEMAGGGDHWTPFSGSHNSYSLTGVSVRVSGKRKVHRLAPFVSAGVFNGHVHSEKLGIRKDQIVPSVALGVRYQLHRDVSLSARYRFTPPIHGVNTSGFSVGLSFN